MTSATTTHGPSTPQPAARPSSDPLAELRRVYELQKANRWRMAGTTADERVARLRKLRDRIGETRQQLEQAIWDDFHKSPSETDVTEVAPTLDEIDFAMKHLRKWMKPIKVKTPLALFGTRSKVKLEPKGMVLILSPWNYPFYLLICPLVAAIAAGNVAILKPSAKVPHTSRYLYELISGTFPEDEVALFEGGHDVSDALLEMPFDHVFFTGSPRIGKKIMAAAAKNLASVTLELGGKSPVIVDETADLSKAADDLMWGKLVNAGQTCVAPDYALVHESRVDALVRECEQVVSRHYGATEEQRRESPDYCRLVTEAHLNELKKLLDDTVATGAKVRMGGVTGDGQRYLSPTILTDVKEDSPIMQEEIFGPILPIISYSSLDDAIRFIQSRPKPLALYVFSSDEDNVDRILENTTSGGVTVNNTLVHLLNPELPFGGVGNSGQGNYHGYWGFRSLSHERAVLTQGRRAELEHLVHPPYTAKVKERVQAAIKFLLK